MELDDKTKAPTTAVSYIKYLAEMMAFDYEMVIQSNDPISKFTVTSVDAGHLGASLSKW